MSIEHYNVSRNLQRVTHPSDQTCDDCSPGLRAEIERKRARAVDRALDLEGARAVDRVMARRSADSRTVEKTPAERRAETMAYIHRNDPPASRKSPEVISRMSEERVYDLRSIRTDPFSRDALRGELIDRARRANDLANYPTAGRDQERVQEHIDDLLTRSDTPNWNGAEVAHRILATGSQAYRRAFAKIMIDQVRMSSSAVFTPEEQQAIKVVDQMRAMTVGSGAGGGFAVPFALDPTLVPTSNGSRNPFRAACRVISISGTNEWRQPTSGAMVASYATEAAQASDNSPTLAQPALKTVRAQAFAPVSFELSEDWGNLEDQLGALILSARDDLEATKFTSGSGTNEPEGLLTGATGITITPFARDGLYTVEMALAPRFRTQGAWFGNKTAFDEMLKLANTGAFIWLQNPPNKISNTGYSLIGYPAWEDSAMTSAITTTNKVFVILDPSYYVICDRVGLDLEVTTWLYQQTLMGTGSGLPTGQRGILALWRNFARLLDANAARVYQVT